jgi:hypothetical protein
MGGDDAIVKDEFDVRLRGEAMEGGDIVFLRWGLDGCNAQVLIAMDETGAGGGHAGLGVGRDGRVAIEDKVVVGCDATGIDLGGCCAR